MALLSEPLLADLENLAAQDQLVLQPDCPHFVEGVGPTQTVSQELDQRPVTTDVGVNPRGELVDQGSLAP